VPILDASLEHQVREEILEPTIRGMAEEGMPYRGFLYAGLMIVDGRPYVLEFNCRLGDPEAQPLMARFRSDLARYLVGAADGSVALEQVDWDGRAALCVVMASKGYPGQFQTGLPIDGVAEAAAGADVMVFQAGTRAERSKLFTAGGRVLGVTGMGDTLSQARDRAYACAASISWPGAHYRRDIGHRALFARHVERALD
jgi:phosphoribosylamine--glycine ligase